MKRQRPSGTSLVYPNLNGRMNKSVFRRNLMAVTIALAAVALLLAGAPPAFVSSGSNRNDQSRGRHSELKARLASVRSAEFQDALSEAARLDEPGALDVWRAALNNNNPLLRRKAWIRYRGVQAQLTRKQFVPRVIRVDATAAEVSRLANSIGVDVTIWSSSDSQTVAAAPPYLIERLRTAGKQTQLLFDSVETWQQARARGDAVAQAITPDYQSDTGRQIRIAVIDLANRGPVSSGYSTWLGDQENILMSEGSRVAFLDVFASDGSPASINAHVEELYTRRGYKLTGFYTTEQFADIAPRLFPGKSFDAGRRMKSDSGHQVGIALANGKFHSYQQTNDEFKALASTYPNLARYSALGSSFEGRDIFALKISKDASVDDSSKPDVLITGCHHAREWISVEAPVYFANQLLSGYATDDSIKYLVDHLQIWIVPIVNPDGLTYSQNSPNDRLDPVRLWRKNRRPVPGAECVSAVGIDLNRNYSFEWRLDGDSPCVSYCPLDSGCTNDDVGGSDDPGSETYRGPNPESELEVKAIKALVDDPGRHFRAQLDYHNYNQLILYPWGYGTLGAADASTLSSLAQRISDQTFGVDRVRYRPEQAVRLYSLTGSSIDYAYGVNHVAAPFVVEMRPECCDFSVTESAIPKVNQENWAGARSLLDWAGGPPILESVKAYSPGPDGLFSKLIYSARWTTSPIDAGQRQLIVDTSFPGISPGLLQVRLQFSRPMNTSLPPRATLGRDGILDQVILTAVGDSEGWQRTNYLNDTWIGETVIVEDSNQTSPWRIAVSATGPAELALDAMPNTIAGYTGGVGHWDNFEDASGAGFDGGIDTQHSLGPGLRSDRAAILVASPNGGERLASGDTYTVVWTAPTGPGSDPSLSLSTDGGVSFTILVNNVPSNAQRFDVTLPQVATTGGRIRVLAFDPASHNFLAAASQANFTIGTNVGSNVDISFVSSEKVDLNWTDVPFEDPRGPASGASRLIVNLRITNRGSTTILSPFLRVSQLTRNVLLTRDPKSKWTAGARQTIDAGSDNALSPGESADAHLVVGLLRAKKFFLSVQLYGVPSEGSIGPGVPVDVWAGKPQSR